jgi:hypothetical protein
MVARILLVHLLKLSAHSVSPVATPVASTTSAAAAASGSGAGGAGAGGAFSAKTLNFVPSHPILLLIDPVVDIGVDIDGVHKFNKKKKSGGDGVLTSSSSGGRL